MINCIIVDNDKNSRKKTEGLVSQIKHLTVLKACAKISEAGDIFSRQPVDILFFEMTEANYNDLEILHTIEVKPQIIVTGHAKELAEQAFDADAVDFILKPVTLPRVVKALTKALQLKGAQKNEIARNSSSIFIKEKQRLIKVPFKDIFLVEALADYVHIYTPVKRYTIHATMKNMETRLPKLDFVRVHKSYIVRLDRITEVAKKALSVEKKPIPVSNTYKDELIRRLRII